MIDFSTINGADLFLGSSILVFLGIFLLNTMVFIIITTSFTILLWLPKTLSAVNSLAKYPRILESESCGTDLKGETFHEKYTNVMRANFFIGVSLFLTLTFTFNTLPEIFLNKPNSPLYQNTTILIPFTDFSFTLFASESSLSSQDIAFFLTLIVIPVFLLSLRFLTNPRKKTNSILYNELSL